MLVTVSSHIDPTDAHIMRCRLEAEGIEAFVAHEHQVRMNWFQAMALGGAQVQVAESDAAAALAIVSGVSRGEYALPDEPEDAKVCPKCHSPSITSDKITRNVSLWSSFLLSIPLPFSNKRVRCQACGYAGHQDEF